MERNPAFLHEKYTSLHSSKEVLSVARRKKGEKEDDQETEIDLSQDPLGRIQDYLDYLSSSVDEANPEREEKLARFKQKVHEQYCITNFEQVPDNYWKSIQEKHRREGREVPEITTELRRELAEPIIRDQNDSLDGWIDYLSSADAKYPDWIKYWAMRSVLNMGRYDKENKRFAKREGKNKTISPFPDLNQEALALVVDGMIKKYAGQKPDFGYDVSDATKESFLAELDKENFAKLYAIAIEEFKPISDEFLKNIDGHWVRYEVGSEPGALVESLKHYGTGWCIRGESTARRYLQGGKHEEPYTLDVFYSFDKTTQEDDYATARPAVPRVVIVHNEDGISEVRGVAKQENLDRYIGPVVDAKLKEFPDGEKWKKKTADMEQLTQIEDKLKAKETLSRKDLVFLYEVDNDIEGFGYKTDPRIAELKQARVDAGMLESDMLVIFDCTPEQIAQSEEQVADNKERGIETKVYMGPLYPNIFVDLADVEYIFTSFMEGRKRKERLKIGGKTVEDLENQLNEQNIKIDRSAQVIIDSDRFYVEDEEEELILVRLMGGDLGLEESFSYDMICAKAKELGLSLCPPEVGLQYTLQNHEREDIWWNIIATKPLPDHLGRPILLTPAKLQGVKLLFSELVVSDVDIYQPNRSFIFVANRH